MGACHVGAGVLRLQPLVPLEVLYWTALSVHATSAIAYPLFPWIRTCLAGSPAAEGAAVVTRTAMLIGVLLVALTVAEVLGRSGKEPEWPFEDSIRATFDRHFMASMAGHHATGVELARAALAGPLSDEAAALARLIVAQQSREIDLLTLWWRSWVGGPLPHLREGMVGIPAPADVATLANSRAPDREGRFLRMMIDHHGGALLMAQGARNRAADPRVWLFAVSVSHAQLGQMTWMRALLGDMEADYRPPRLRGNGRPTPLGSAATALLERREGERSVRVREN